MMREVFLETLSNVNIRDPSHDKNLMIMPVTGSINHNIFKLIMLILFTNRLNNLIFLGPEKASVRTQMLSTRRMLVRVDWERAYAGVEEDDDKRFLFCFFITSFER